MDLGDDPAAPKEAAGVGRAGLAEVSRTPLSGRGYALLVRPVKAELVIGLPCHQLFQIEKRCSISNSNTDARAGRQTRGPGGAL
jgi:hypothetical protein